MKKLLLGGLLILANLASSQVRLQFEETKFGIIAGPDVSRVRNAHNPSSARYAFYFGALAEIPLCITSGLSSSITIFIFASSQIVG